MRYGTWYSSFLLVLALLLCSSAPSAAQQIQFFPDFSGPTDPTQFLLRNGSATLATWNDAEVLRLTNGGTPPNPEASTTYFQQNPFSLGVGEQPVIEGFTTWFQFQAHNLQCCSPGDGFAFIVQFATSTDPSYGASGAYSGALGAGNGDLGGGMGYAGINNSLAIEFDLLQDPWDPNGNHIAIQTCGPGTNTPVHMDGSYTIGNHQNVPNCLYNNAIYTPSTPMGGTCNGESCSDGTVHDVVIGYNPPSQTLPGGLLQIWLDPQYLSGTHTPKGRPNLMAPYNIVYDSMNNPLGLMLDPRPGKVGYAWVGFTSSQPDEGMQMDILAWEYTPSGPVQIQQVIQPGGTPTNFIFGSHKTTVTYPQGFMNPNNIVMVVTATPVDRVQFDQTRLQGTQFANEQCIAYQGLGLNMNPIASGTCVVYSYQCQDQQGNKITCPTETDPTIVITTSFDTTDNVTSTNADYLENDAIGSNNWMSIFTGYMSAPIDGTTSGGSRGFGGSGSGKPFPARRQFLTGQVNNADIVATFNPSKP